MELKKQLNILEVEIVGKDLLDKVELNMMNMMKKENEQLNDEIGNLKAEI